MPTYFQRPENALKRANEFIDVGKKQRALDVLYDVIKSKKHRTWQKIHEPIMEMYLELCVELRKSHVAKEGLYQYKNICQQVNIQSLVEVVRKYISLAEEKTDAAREQSHQTVVDIDDLDVPSPETLLLKAVSGEDAQDRTDRAILTPWVKFLWESYRQCLDLLRNNSRVERLYQDIAQQAFKFCLKYSRKTEFRKLCDNLRTHLGHVHKHQHQQTAINLNNPDSQAMHLETRLEQLNNAINMELWQEAFKAVEDIHGLINLSKKSPKPSLMANYYQKLGLVFWKSGSHLFHASTLHRVFHLTREQRKNLSQDELQRMASRVLCATLAIPIPASRNSIGQLLDMDESSMEKQRHLATLLMLPAPPTRQALIKDLVKYNILQYVSPELQNLYRWLEVEFHPLRLVTRVTPSIEFISKSEDLGCYIPAIEDIIITRVLKQVSQVYQAIELSRLASLVPFASQFRLERVIVNAAKTLELQVRICHKTKSISFGTNLGVAQKEDVPEGPYIQSMPSEQIRNQLTCMAHALQQAIAIIAPKDVNEPNDLRNTIVNNYRMTGKKEHLRILQRRQIIEDRKEQLEHMNDQREREESQMAESQRKKAYEAEMARLEREALERKKQRQHQEHQEIKRKHVKERIEQLRKTDIGSRIFKDIDEEEFAELDVDEIMQKQVEQLEKEKKELHERLKGQEKKVDYFQRARRLQEIPLLEKQYEEDDIQARAFWEEHELERIEGIEKERAYALITQERLNRMKVDKNEFINRLRDARKSEYETHLKEFETKIAQERKNRLRERKAKRKEERRIKWKEDRAEAKQRAKDEALKRDREEKERIEQEKREQEESEYQEKLMKLEQQAEKQRQREREIEERQKQRQESSVPPREEEPSRDTWRRGEVDGESDWRKNDGGGESDWRKNDGGGESDWRKNDGGGESDWRKNDGGGGERPAWRPRPREGGGWREREKERDNSWKREPERDAPREEGGWRDRGPPKEDRDFRDRGPPKEDRDFRDRGPPKEDRDFRDRGPTRDNRDFRDRGPPREDRDFKDIRERARPMDDRNFRDMGPSRDDKDFRGPRDDRDFRDRDPPRDDRDFRDRDPPRDDRDFRDRGPSRDDRDFRDRGPPKDDFRDRAPPRDDRDFRDKGPSRDDRFDRGPREDQGRGWRDHGPSRDGRGPPGGTWRDRERGADDHRDERGPPARGESSWRDRAPPSRLDDRGAPSNEKRPDRPQDDDGWTTVRR